MDFYAETEKRKQQHLGQIGDLAYRRYLASKAIEDAEREIAELDVEIARHETAMRELDQAQRNFNSYLAVREAALTTDDLAQAIRNGAQEEPQEEPKKPAKRKEKRKEK